MVGRRPKTVGSAIADHPGAYGEEVRNSGPYNAHHLRGDGLVGWAPPTKHFIRSEWWAVPAPYACGPADLVGDIGSNDGTLLSNFQEGHRVHGIEPTDAGKLAIGRGIPTLISFFNREAVRAVVDQAGRAKVVTATNVF